MKLPLILALVALVAIFVLDRNDAFATTGLAGSVYIDTNGNGVPDSDEPGRAGITVLWVDMSDWSKVGRTTTDSTGSFFFEIPAGDYLVQLEGVPAEQILTGHAYLTIPADLISVQTFLLRAEPDEEEPPDNASLLSMIKDLIQRLEALEMPVPDIDCPEGQVLVDGTCTDIVCPIGYELDGNYCDRIRCDRGYELNHSTNTCEFAGCPSNYVLNGNECVFDTTGHYITTDKTTYILGDTVHVTGKMMDPLTRLLLDGTMVYPDSENINITISPANQGKRIDYLYGCHAWYPYDIEKFNAWVQSDIIRDYGSPTEFGKYYHYYHNDGVDERVECTIENGMITGSFEITGDLIAGTYKIRYLHQSSPMGAETDRYLSSPSFVIR